MKNVYTYEIEVTCPEDKTEELETALEIAAKQFGTNVSVTEADCRECDADEE